MKNDSCSCEHSLWLPYVMLSLTGGKKKKQNKILIKLFLLFDVLTLSIPSILPSLGIRTDLKLLSLRPPLCLEIQIQIQ